MRSIMRKVFDCTLGALWRLYVKIIVDDIFVFGCDRNFIDWAIAIVVTALFICAIPFAFMLLLSLAIVAIDFPLQVICSIIVIAVICMLPKLALKSYWSSKAKATAIASPSKVTKSAIVSKKGFSQ